MTLGTGDQLKYALKSILETALKLYTPSNNNEHQLNTMYRTDKY